MKKGDKWITIINKCPKCKNDNYKDIWKYGKELRILMDEVKKVQRFKCKVCGHVWTN